jgi:hypothetical protein
MNTDQSTAQLVGQLSEQVGRLAREEIRLAVAELRTKGKRVGTGAGLLGGAGVLAWFGVMGLLTGLVLLLATVMPAWLAAFVVAVAVFAVAGGLALVGRGRSIAAHHPSRRRPSRASSGTSPR